MTIEALQGRAVITLELNELETYPAWTTTMLAVVKIKDGDRWTDCYLSAIKKGGRVKFILSHERGYPSENKGTATKSITASWVSNELPKLD